MTTVGYESANEPTVAEEKISADIADWSRETPHYYWDPSRRLLKSIRDYQRHFGSFSILHRLWRCIAVIRYRFWSTICACDIPLNSNLGGGLILMHPNGIVIHPSAEVGVNCLIFQQVTLVGGVKLKGHVDVGAGAKIIRPVTIGRHAKVGANSVVLQDVPDGAVAVGVPAKILSNTENISTEYMVDHVTSP